MSNEAPDMDITKLLHAWQQGDAEAREQLFVRVQRELRALAESQMRRERAGHTLPPTALVNEAYLRLAKGQPVEWQNRLHFFGLMARLMREVLVDYAREHRRLKRNAGVPPLALTEVLHVADERGIDVLRLDEALQDLERFAPRQCQVVVLRFFGGLTIEEIAALLAVAPITIKREWQAARLWLLRELKVEVPHANKHTLNDSHTLATD